MSYEEIVEALDGFFAWDQGATDSGIKNDTLRAEVRRLFREGYSDEELRVWLARYVRNEWLSEEAIEAGYGLEDVAAFAEWFDDFYAHG